MNTGSGNQADFYVAPLGNDEWSGTLDTANAAGTDGPFATPSRARDAVRQLKEESPARDIVVLFRGGTYYLSETLVFGIEDTAETGTTVTYAGYPGEEPVFSSGFRISGWQELRKPPQELPELAKGKVWVADIPANLGRFKTLYDGGKRLERARSHPFGVERRKNEREIPDAHTRLEYAPGTIKDWANVEDVDVIVRNYGFTITILSLTSNDADARVATTNAPSYGRLPRVTGPGSWDVRPGEKAVWVENILEGITAPGQWALNTREGRLYLWPTGDEPSGNIMAPALTELFRVEGQIDIDGPTDVPVTGIVFKGLTFTQADRGVVVDGDKSIQHDWEMVDKADALLRFRGAENCGVEECRFVNSGGSAVRLDLHCQNNSVINNSISHLGGAGVLLIGYGPGTKDVNKANEISNNHIHHNGEIYWHSHGIVLWQSGGNHVANNCIHHMPRKGICVTGSRPQFFDPDEFLARNHPPLRENTPTIRWFEIHNADEVKARAGNMPWEECDIVDWPEIIPYLHTKNNVVENNEIYRVGQTGEDGSAINVSGAGDGNLIRHNYIHDVYSAFHGCIRVDDYQRMTTIEQNIMFRSTACGICTRHENYWLNNVIVDVRPGNAIWVGERRYDGTILKGNIVLQSSGDLTFFEFSRHHTMSNNVSEHFEKMERGEIDGNVYYQVDAPDGESEDLAAIKAVGHDQNSIYADPLFEDWQNGNFTLKPGSPALKMGIKSIDVSLIGLTEDYPKRFSDAP